MSSLFLIPSAIVIEVSGPDAARYLNARLTNDIKKMLKPERALLAAALSPQGRTQGLFLVSGDVSQKVLLVCDGGNKEEVVAAFRKYIVADRVQVDDRSEEFAIVHVIGAQAIARASAIVELVVADIEHLQVVNGGATRVIGRYRSSELGADFIMPRDVAANFRTKLLGSEIKELSPAEQEFRRIAAAIPTFPTEINEESLFSESGMLEAISFNKGCYTGQEVVERVDSKGKLAKVLKLIRAVEPFPLSTGDQVYQELKDLTEGPAIGKVVSVAKDVGSGVTVSFAQLKNDPSALSQSVFVRGNRWEVVDSTGIKG